MDQASGQRLDRPRGQRKTTAGTPEPATKKAGYPGIDYKMVPVHSPNPDYYSYVELLRRQESELKESKENRERK